MDATKFGAFVQSQRKVLSLTQAQLGEKLGVTDKAISRWERGVGFPDIGLLEPLAQALEVTVVELMRGEQMEQEQISIQEVETMMVQTIDLAQELERTKRRNRLLRFVAMPALFCGYMVLFMAITEYIQEPAWLGRLCRFLVMLGLIYGSRAIGYIARCDYLKPATPRKPLAHQITLNMTVLGVFAFFFSFLLNTDGLRHLYVLLAIGGLLLSFAFPLYLVWRVCKENSKEA